MVGRRIGQTWYLTLPHGRQLVLPVGRGGTSVDKDVAVGRVPEANLGQVGSIVGRIFFISWLYFSSV